MQNNYLEMFGLTHEQTKILFSLQKELVEVDIKNEKKPVNRLIKAMWKNKWERKMEAFMSLTSKSEVSTMLSLKESSQQLAKFNERLPNETSLYLIMLELALFVPYYPLVSKDSDEAENEDLDETENKDLDEACKELKCKWCSETDIIKVMEVWAGNFGIKAGFVKKCREGYKSSVSSLARGDMLKLILAGLAGALTLSLTAGFSATVIAPLFAAAGLTGAAAITSGLAALGGGAIAAGGYGMAGGFAVIVGGGAIIGGGIGGAGYAMLANSQYLTISQCAKFEVILKEVILNYLNNLELARNLIQQQRNTTNKLADMRLSMNNANGSKELDESINVIKKAIEINEKNVIKAKEATEKPIKKEPFVDTVIGKIRGK